MKDTINMKERFIGRSICFSGAFTNFCNNTRFPTFPPNEQIVKIGVFLTIKSFEIILN